MINVAAITFYTEFFFVIYFPDATQRLMQMTVNITNWTAISTVWENRFRNTGS